MAVNHPIDWLQSTNKDRKKLYPVACAVKNLLDLKDWNAFLAIALERPQRFGSSFAGNFRKGKISRKIALDIYSWIATHHLEVGQRLCKELFPTSSLTAWEELVSSQGFYGYLYTRNPEALALTSRDDDGLRIEDEPILVKEPYCFLLTGQPEGSAILFERHEGRDWFPVPIGATSKALVASLPKERAIMPWDTASQTPVILREHVDTGLREFVLIHGDADLIAAIEGRLLLNEAIHASTLNDFATLCLSPDSGFIGLHRLNVVFQRSGS